MIGPAKRKIGIRVTLLVNIILFIMMTIGGLVIYYQEAELYKQYLIEKGKLASMIGARSVSTVLEEAIDNGVLTLKEIVTTNKYEEIPGFDPPKYHTAYDWYTDKSILALQDEFLKSPDILYAVAEDIKGYVPTHNTRYNKPITGDRKKDLVGNRSKRFFTDPIAMKAVANETPGLLQLYPRDTGEMVWDISSPIYIKGKHWGCFRIGFELGTIKKAQKNLMLYLGITILMILIISICATSVVINSVLRPLGEFTRMASDLADGNVDDKIESKSEDEIGKLADVLERLRVSLKAAMDRLSR